jgi:hypothetical protein
MKLKTDTTCPFYISHLWSIISVLYVIDVWRRVFLFLWLSRNVDTSSAIFTSFYNNSVSLVNYDVSSLPMFRLYLSRVSLRFDYILLFSLSRLVYKRRRIWLNKVSCSTRHEIRSCYRFIRKKSYQKITFFKTHLNYERCLGVFLFTRIWKHQCFIYL